MNTSIMNDSVTTITIQQEKSNEEQTRFVYLSFYIVLMIVNLWLIISLIHYGIKTKKWRRLQSGNPNLLNSGRIYSSIVICSVTVFFSSLFIVVYHNIGFHPNNHNLCNAVGGLIIITCSSCFLSLVFFLWFRQRTLYTAFLPIERFTKPLKFFSFIIIFVSIFLVVSGVIFSILTSNFDTSQTGCVFGNEKIFKFVIFLIAGTCIIFSQVALLITFICALLTMQKLDGKESWKSLLCCKYQPSNEPTTEQRANRRRAIIKKIIKKATVFAALSLLSDLLVISLTFLISWKGNRHEIISALGSLSVSMNLYFAILSFTSWKDMITSPCKSLGFT